MSQLIVCDEVGPRIQQEVDWLAGVALALGRKLKVFDAPDPSVATDCDPATTDADLIWLEFPAFGNGRHYSTAARLVEAGFKGIIAAQGEAVCTDQVGMMQSCGITVFRPRQAADQPALIAALTRSAMRRFPSR